MTGELATAVAICDERVEAARALREAAAQWHRESAYATRRYPTLAEREQLAHDALAAIQHAYAEIGR